jgi:hypothetical protein
MAFILDDYIDKYIQDAGHTDKKIARHLKEIIPKTTHLDENTFNEIIEGLKQEMDEGKDFKSAFFNVYVRYVLKGDIIKAELPGVLTRILLNKAKFIIYIKNLSKAPYNEQEIGMILTSKDKGLINDLLAEGTLSRGEAVFATFDEKNEDRSPFLNRKVIEIINMLALDRDIYEEGQPLTAVKIRYKNSEDFGKKYPTFIDAGWGDKFYPAAKDDNYGRTRKLDDLSPSMPEIVHENRKFSDVVVESLDFLKDG